jgi:hypothetical protein
MLLSTEGRPLLDVYLLGNRSIVWGTSPVFGEPVLWRTNVSGQSILGGTDTLAGENILWSTNGANASTILWGTSVLWGIALTGRDTAGQGDLF